MLWSLQSRLSLWRANDKFSKGRRRPIPIPLKQRQGMGTTRQTVDVAARLILRTLQQLLLWLRRIMHLMVHGGRRNAVSPPGQGRRVIRPLPRRLIGIRARVRSGGGAPRIVGAVGVASPKIPVRQSRQSRLLLRQRKRTPLRRQSAPSPLLQLPLLPLPLPPYRLLHQQIATTPRLSLHPPPLALSPPPPFLVLFFFLCLVFYVLPPTTPRPHMRRKGMTQQTPPAVHFVLHRQRQFLRRDDAVGLRPAVGAAAFAFAVAAEGGGVVVFVLVVVTAVVIVVVIVGIDGGADATKARGRGGIAEIGGEELVVGHVGHVRREGRRMIRHGGMRDERGSMTMVMGEWVILVHAPQCSRMKSRDGFFTIITQNT